MQFLCVVSASYTLGCLVTKNPWLVFQLKHEISKQNFFCIFVYGKNVYHTISFMEKILFCYFRTHFVHIWKLHDKHFLSTRAARLALFQFHPFQVFHRCHYAMKFGIVKKSTTVNRFVLHTLQRYITHLAVITRKTNIKLGISKRGLGKSR